jgi:hypothetical protein
MVVGNSPRGGGISAETLGKVPAPWILTEGQGEPFVNGEQTVGHPGT